MDHSKLSWEKEDIIDSSESLLNSGIIGAFINEHKYKMYYYNHDIFSYLPIHNNKYNVEVLRKHHQHTYLITLCYCDHNVRAKAGERNRNNEHKSL